MSWTWGLAAVHRAAQLAAQTRISAGGAAASVFLLIYLAIVVISIIAAVKVVTKAGYSGWWVLVLIVPVANVVMALVFAFSEWPVIREVKMLRSQPSTWPGHGTGPSFGQGTYGGGAGLGGGSFSSQPGPGGAAPASPAQHDEQAPGAEGSGDAANDPVAEEGAQAPPGWYPTPDGRVRYWDGAAWSDHFA